MALGPGRYSQQAERVMHDENASMVILMVLNGQRGSGFDVVGDVGVVTNGKVVELLRFMADEIEKTLRKAGEIRGPKT